MNIKAGSKTSFASASPSWKTYGEGPSTVAAETGRFGGQSDTQRKPFTAEDIRLTQSKNGKTLYSIVLAFPTDGKVRIKSLANNSAQWPGKVGSVRMLRAGKVKFTRDDNSLNVTLPEKNPCEIAFALKISS